MANITWSNDIHGTGVCPSWVEINGHWGYLIIGARGSLTCDSMVRQHWEDFLCGTAFTTQLNGAFIGGALEDIEKEDEIIKTLTTSVNKDGNIIELLIRKPRSENERSEINERERSSKSRDLRRENGRSQRETEREISRARVC